MFRGVVVVAVIVVDRPRLLPAVCCFARRQSADESAINSVRENPSRAERRSSIGSCHRRAALLRRRTILLSLFLSFCLGLSPCLRRSLERQEGEERSNGGVRRRSSLCRARTTRIPSRVCQCTGVSVCACVRASNTDVVAVADEDRWNLSCPLSPSLSVYIRRFPLSLHPCDSVRRLCYSALPSPRLRE